MDPGGIAGEGLWRGHVLDPNPGPNPVRVAEGVEPALLADAGPGEDQDGGHRKGPLEARGAALRGDFSVPRGGRQPPSRRTRRRRLRDLTGGKAADAGPLERPRSVHGLAIARSDGGRV